MRIGRGEIHTLHDEPAEASHIECAESDPPPSGKSLVAVDPAIFGLFRMYGRRFELQVGGSAVGVFTTLDDAIEWVTP